MEARELLRELKRTVDELQAFNEIGKALTSTLDIREVLGLIMEKVGELLSPSNWSLLLADDSGDLVFEIVVGPGAEGLKGLKLQHGEGIAGWVAREGQPLLVPDVTQDPRFASRFDARTRFTTRSVLAVPMRSRGRTLGLIELVNAPEQKTFGKDDLRTLSSLADYAAIAIENARNFQRVQELTILDEHTGLYNSRHLHRVLEAEIVRARRFGHALSLVFLDLDHFKRVNDTYGHQNGSALLRECGEVLLSVLRSVDVATRYGGDEFVCLLPETDKKQAEICAHRLRDALNAHTFLGTGGLSVKVTASFGIATFPDDASSEHELMRQADLAMYRVKESTRDGIASATTASAGTVAG
jgi:diguanylate cyclase (GGDEF)-like protein